jgi:hypothetical protein
MQPFLVDPSGNIKVNVAAGGAAGGTSSNFASPFPIPGTAVGATDGTNMRPLNVDGSGNLKVNIVTGAGSGGTASTFGAAFPAAGLGTPAGATDGLNMRPIKVDSSLNLFVRQNDGFNNSTIKAASVPAAQTDTAMVDRNPDVGTVTDSVYSGSGSTTVIGALKGLYSGVTSPVPAGSNKIGSVGIDGTIPGSSNSVSFGSDPCTFLPKTNVPISIASAGTTVVIAAVSAKRTFICSMVLMSSSATTLSVAEGQGASCTAPNQAGMIGVGTNVAATGGLSFPVTGGLTLGNGTGTVTQTANINANVCIYNVGASQVSGNMTYVTN